MVRFCATSHKQVKVRREKMKFAQDRQRSYNNKRWRPLEFQEGDHIFLRVTPKIGVGHAIKTSKLTPSFIGPYQILLRLRSVAYRIDLPPSLSNLHSVYQVSHLRKYYPNRSHVIEPESIQVKDTLEYEALPVRTAYYKVKGNSWEEHPISESCLVRGNMEYNVGNRREG